MYIADMHCDSIMKVWLARREGRNISLRDSSNAPAAGPDGLQVDLMKMKAGGYLAQNFALYVDLQIEDGTSPWTQFTEMAEIFHEEMAANADVVRQARTCEEILANRDAGLLSAVMTVEEGGVLEGDLNRLDRLYEEGVRMMTLTWNYENELGSPNDVPDGVDEDYRQFFSFAPRADNGLKQTGFEAVERMQELGIVMDVSHLSDAGFYDVAKAVKGPFVASHSNARAISGCHRNMTDDMIRTVGEHGGVIGLNFCPEFLEEGPSEAECRSTIDGLVQHARHIMNAGGREVLGIGTDFDGMGDCPLEIGDASQMPALIDGFQRQGFTESEIEDICWRNALRVYKEVWK